jgi:Flp pilus assembly protein TadB
MIWLFIIVVTVLALLAGAVAVMWWRTEVAPRHTAALKRIEAETEDAKQVVEAIAREAQRRMIEILLAARSIRERP